MAAEALDVVAAVEDESLDVEFREDNHTYHVMGVEVPSVTRILKSITNFGGIPGHILEKARIRGQNVHAAVDLYDSGQLNEETLHPEIAAYLKGYKKFLHESAAVVIASELIVHSPTYKFAGRVDKVFLLRDKYTIVDVKATAALPKTAGAQTAAYRQAYEESSGIRVPNRHVVQLRPNGYTLYPMKDAADWSLFQSCLNVWHFNSKFNPRMQQ